MPRLSPRFGSRNQDPGSAFWNGQGSTHSLRPASKRLRLKDAPHSKGRRSTFAPASVLFVFTARLIRSRMAQLIDGGSVCLLAAAGDVRMLVRGGVLGAKRIARHLWRMCFGLFIAAGSFFLGHSNRPLRLLSTVGLGQHLSPALFSTSLYLILSILPLILLIFWLVRVRFANAYDGKSMIPGRVARFVGQKPDPENRRVRHAALLLRLVFSFLS